MFKFNFSRLPEPSPPPQDALAEAQALELQYLSSDAPKLPAAPVLKGADHDFAIARAVAAGSGTASLITAIAVVLLTAMPSMAQAQCLRSTEVKMSEQIFRLCHARTNRGPKVTVFDSLGNVKVSVLATGRETVVMVGKAWRTTPTGTGGQNNTSHGSPQDIGVIATASPYTNLVTSDTAAMRFLYGRQP